METKEQLRERKSVLEKRIMTLEWDKDHRQIHAGQDRKLENFKKELDDIEKQLSE